MVRSEALRAGQAALASLATLALSAALLACSSSSDPPAGGGDAGATETGPRAFRKDVIPVLAAFCATSACHGSKENNLGVHLLTGDPAAVYAELQRESPTATGVKFIVPGDPAKSFFFAKIEGTQSDFSDKCLIPACGETMPPGSKLTTAQRATIRQWIADGAKND